MRHLVRPLRPDPTRPDPTRPDPTGLAEDHLGGAYDPKGPASRESLLLGGALADRTEAARDASPVTRVSPDAPPFLILHGTDDTLVPARQSVRLAEALRAAGHQPDLRLLTGGNHLRVGLRTLEFARRRTST
ncbi:prolyl oligopeptidase family serine peptidase [Streptomyces sp. NPDC085944]|uniref:prolyl oligopeptidase family serine peptidase n=1 Tax=Streptomyces sp. NPDC085944 TaxID=3154962 RepID=UPI003437F191